MGSSFLLFSAEISTDLKLQRLHSEIKISLKIDKAVSSTNSSLSVQVIKSSYKSSFQINVCSFFKKDKRLRLCCTVFHVSYPEMWNGIPESLLLWVFSGKLNLVNHISTSSVCRISIIWDSGLCTNLKIWKKSIVVVAHKRSLLSINSLQQGHRGTSTMWESDAVFCDGVSDPRMMPMSQCLNFLGF